MEAQNERGEIITSSRDDILAKAIQKPDYGGRVRAVGSGVTNRAYFGYNRPTPPTMLQAKVVTLETELENMKNNQNLLMSYVMSCSSGFNPEHMRQFMAVCNGFGGQGCGNAQVGSFINLLSGQGLGGSQPSTSNGQGGRVVLD